MRKIIILFITFVTVLSFAFTQDSGQDYIIRYRAAPTYSTQLVILQEMAETRPSGTGDFYAQALERLVSEYPNIRDDTEKYAAGEQALILATLLGREENSSEAVSALSRAAEFFDDSRVKSESLISLGRINAVDSIPLVIRMLNNANASTPSDHDRSGVEAVAIGAINALERFQDASGYLPVFLASEGWYSNRIKEQAKRSLSLIAQDPTPFMLEVIRGSYPLELKLIALRTINTAEGVSNQSKGNTAVAALAEGWRAPGVTEQARSDLADLRLLALDMISRFRTDDEAAYPLMERSYLRGFGQERYLAISALASQRSSESARILSEFLTELNAKARSEEQTRDDEQLARAIIPALGHNGHPDGLAALRSVAFSGWGSSVVRLANAAIRQIGR